MTATVHVLPARCPWCGMPTIDGICHACFPAPNPSRDFLIRQAILNALVALFPFSAVCLGPAYVLRNQKYLSWYDFRKSALYSQTLVEYRKMVNP